MYSNSVCEERGVSPLLVIYLHEKSPVLLEKTPKEKSHNLLESLIYLKNTLKDTSDAKESK